MVILTSSCHILSVKDNIGSDKNYFFFVKIVVDNYLVFVLCMCVCVCCSQMWESSREIKVNLDCKIQSRQVVLWMYFNPLWLNQITKQTTDINTITTT